MKINWKAIGTFIGEAVVEGINESAAQRAERERKLEEQRKIDASVERVMTRQKSTTIDKDDLNELRNQVMAIIRTTNNSYAKSKGKTLLKDEVRYSYMTEEKTKREFYEYIIEYGMD